MVLTCITSELRTLSVIQATPGSVSSDGLPRPQRGSPTGICVASHAQNLEGDQRREKSPTSISLRTGIWKVNEVKIDSCYVVLQLRVSPE